MMRPQADAELKVRAAGVAHKATPAHLLTAQLGPRPPRGRGLEAIRPYPGRALGGSGPSPHRRAAVAGLGAGRPRPPRGERPSLPGDVPRCPRPAVRFAFRHHHRLACAVTTLGPVLPISRRGSDAWVAGLDDSPKIPAVLPRAGKQSAVTTVAPLMRRSRAATSAGPDEFMVDHVAGRLYPATPARATEKAERTDVATREGGLPRAPRADGATRPIAGGTLGPRLVPDRVPTARDRTVARPRPPAGALAPAGRGSPQAAAPPARFATMAGPCACGGQGTAGTTLASRPGTVC